MTNQATQMNHNSNNRLRLFQSTLITFTFLIFATACSTTCPRKEKIELVLDEQTKLLQAVKAEREDEKVATKIKADADLLAAEAHLKTALEMQIRATQAIKADLNKK